LVWIQAGGVYNLQGLFPGYASAAPRFAGSAESVEGWKLSIRLQIASYRADRHRPHVGAQFRYVPFDAHPELLHIPTRIIKHFVVA
jgi:hypothetical protein